MRLIQVITVIPFFLLVYGALISFPAYAFAGGDGSSSSPYQIATCSQLQNMESNLSAHYELTDDIDCSGTNSWNSNAGFDPIGFSYSEEFTGSFDGNNYNITGLSIDRTSSNIGLFGQVSGAAIRDVTLDSVDITSTGDDVGALVGLAHSSSEITNVAVTNGSVIGGDHVGGIVGRLVKSDLSSSHAAIAVSGTQAIGGAIGEHDGGLNNTDSIVEDVYATGDVKVDNNHAGGLVGYKVYGTIKKSYATGDILGDTSGGTTNEVSGGLVGEYCYGKIEQSYATGDVYGNDDVGGFAGQTHNCSSGVVTDSYATGDVYPSGGNGGSFMGYVYLSTVTNSYALGSVNGRSDGGFIYWDVGCGNCSNNFWDIDTSGQSSGGVFNGGGAIGKTTSEMQDVATYTDTSSNGLDSAWDFAGDPNNDSAGGDIWQIDSGINNGYPYFGWQTFNTAPNTPSSLGPNAVTDGSWSNDSTPTLSFSLSDSDGGDTVQSRVQIDNNSDFSSPEVDYTSGLGAQRSENFTVGQAAGDGSYNQGSAGQELADGAYYWRVKTIDQSAASSAYATANSGNVAFRIDTTTPDTPNQPSATSATDDATPTWDWDTVSDSASGLGDPKYTVQWSTDANFVSNVSSANVNTSTYTHKDKLDDATWYFRVKAQDAAGNVSAYSPKASLTIGSVVEIGVTSEVNLANATNNDVENDIEEDQSTESSEKVVLNDFAAFKTDTGKLMQLAPNQVVYFLVQEQEHSVTVEEITANTMVQVTIASDPQKRDIVKGEAIRHDVTGDGQADIKIAAETIGASNVDMRFWQLEPDPVTEDKNIEIASVDESNREEETVQVDNTTTESNNNAISWILISLFGGVTLLSGVAIALRKKQQRV